MLKITLFCSLLILQFILFSSNLVAQNSNTITNNSTLTFKLKLIESPCIGEQSGSITCNGSKNSCTIGPGPNKTVTITYHLGWMIGEEIGGIELTSTSNNLSCSFCYDVTADGVDMKFAPNSSAWCKGKIKIDGQGNITIQN